MRRTKKIPAQKMIKIFEDFKDDPYNEENWEEDNDKPWKMIPLFPLSGVMLTCIMEQISLANYRRSLADFIRFLILNLKSGSHTG